MSEMSKCHSEGHRDHIEALKVSVDAFKRSNEIAMEAMDDMKKENAALKADKEKLRQVLADELDQCKCYQWEDDDCSKCQRLMAVLKETKE